MTQRAAFEAWCKQKYKSLAYLHTSGTSGKWDTWQAAQAQAAPFNDVTQLQIAYIKGLGDGRAQAAVEPVTANNDEVICPNCCNQFRAIPVNVQAEISALHAEIERLTKQCKNFAASEYKTRLEAKTTFDHYREAMRLALEALQNSLPVGTDPVAICERHDAAIAALEKALAL